MRVFPFNSSRLGQREECNIRSLTQSQCSQENLVWTANPSNLFILAHSFSFYRFIHLALHFQLFTIILCFVYDTNYSISFHIIIYEH